MLVVNPSQETTAIVEGELLKLSGKIDMDSVASLYKNGVKALAQPITKVDCHAITSGDSACLALLLFLQSRLDSPIALIRLPASLKVLVYLYCLSDLFTFPEDSEISATH